MSKRSGSTKSDTNSKIKKTGTAGAGAGCDTTAKESENTEPNTQVKYTFKNVDFQHSGAVKSGRKWSWKNLKPIAASERSQAPPDAPIYMNIESPPCVNPVKKYSDVSGQVAKYTDPETGLYYASAKEYKQIKRLTPDIVQGYLDIRNVLP